MSDHLSLNADQLDHLAAAVAQRVIDHLAATPDRSIGPGLVTAAQVAARLGVSRDWVYTHADRLGAVRLGTPEHGAKPRLRFDLDRVLANWHTTQPRPPAQPQPTGTTRRRRTEATVDLLPIGPKHRRAA